MGTTLSQRPRVFVLLTFILRRKRIIASPSPSPSPSCVTVYSRVRYVIMTIVLQIIRNSQVKTRKLPLHRQ